MYTYTSAALTATALYFFNLSGIEGWYIEFWWYDIFMHFLGGMALGLWILSLGKLLEKPRFKPWHIIFFTLLLGLAWEYFEIHFGITGYVVGSRDYFIDTTFDLINDMLGAAFVTLLSYRVFAKRK